jgi:decaprenylphospho-beta-D-erythro-pentofuranosid-2-ulose 2-reductase
VRDAFGRVQSLLLLGGSSEIGLAIARRVVADGCRTVVLAGRSTEAMGAAADELRTAGAGSVSLLAWDALAPETHEALADAALAELDGRDLDLVVLAAGVLGEQADYEATPASAAACVAANFGGAASTLLALTERMKPQGQGTVVVLSSVAGERARPSNFVYGSSKAGLDAFAQGLGDSVRDAGLRVMVVRPGFVATKMTTGMEPAPLSTTPEAVADAVAAGLASGKELVWVPATLRVLFSAFRHLPRPLWRKVSAGR